MTLASRFGGGVSGAQSASRFGGEAGQKHLHKVCGDESWGQQVHTSTAKAGPAEEETTGAKSRIAIVKKSNFNRFAQ